MGMGRGERRELLFVRAVLLEQIFFFISIDKTVSIIENVGQRFFFFARNS